MKTALAILIIMLAPSFRLAQAVKKTSVAVTHSGADQVGQSVAFNLKGQFAIALVYACRSRGITTHAEGSGSPNYH